MKTNSIFKRALMSLLAFAMLITSVVGLSAPKVSAATEPRVISDENATAYIYPNGNGYITLNKVFTDEDPLTEIGGVPLKEIITFVKGGYVDKLWSHLDCNGIIYDNCFCIDGRAPSGLYGGVVRAIDQTNDRYILTLWSSRWMAHYVYYNSDKPIIQTVEWNSI